MTHLKSKLLHRQQLTAALRDFLHNHDYLEADVPVLVPSLIPESYLEVFETKVKGPDVIARSPGTTKQSRNSFPAFLTASPEAYLKRLLVEGSGNVYYLGKAFRNGEPFGPMHNHEFTILEWYKVGATYRSLMSETEEMVRSVQTRCFPSRKGETLTDLSSPWEYITMEEAFELYVPKFEIRNSKFENSELFDRLYVQYIEPNLGTRGKPTFVIDFPTWQSPLAKTRISNVGARSPRPRTNTNEVAERFELYINGIELINGWTELTDWKKQQENFKKEQIERKARGKTSIPSDTGFVEALKKGMPECAGAAMGVDRLLMVLGGYKSLDDVLLFPVKELFKQEP